MRIHRDILAETISKTALPTEEFTKYSAKYIIRIACGISQATPKQIQGPCEKKSPQIQLPEQPHFSPRSQTQRRCRWVS